MGRSTWRGVVVVASLGLLAGCGGDDEEADANGVFVATRIQVERHPDGLGELMIRLWGEIEERCPHLEGPIAVRANGVAGDVIFPGGPTSDIPMYSTCGEATLEVLDVALDGGLTVSIESENLSLVLEWNQEHRVWTADDIAEAMASRDPFTVEWTPDTAPAVALELWGTETVLTDPVAVLEEDGPGWARYHFDGGDPLEAWRLQLTSTLVDQMLADCPLPESCVLDSIADSWVP